MSFQNKTVIITGGASGMGRLSGECFAAEGRATVRVRFAEKAAEGDDMRIYLRERARLEMSLKAARRVCPEGPVVAMMHYPPLTNQLSGFSDLLRAYGVRHCVYGHLHGSALSGAVRGERDGVIYHQVSCDGLDFRLESIHWEQ